MNRRTARKVLAISGVSAVYGEPVAHRRSTLERAAVKATGKSFASVVSRAKAESIRIGLNGWKADHGY
jgi:hypothetical protein